jgi:hypothetical protein
VGHEEVHGLTATSSGDIFVTGSYFGRIDFDPGPNEVFHEVESVGSYFLSKFAPNSDFQWVRSFASGDDGELNVYNITAGPSGDVYFTGAFSGAIDFNPEKTRVDQHTTRDVQVDGETESASDAYITKIGGDGTYNWTKTIAGGPDTAISALDTSPNGAVVVGGYFFETVDLDPGNGVAERTAQENGDMFVASLSAAGDLQWASVFRSGGEHYEVADVACSTTGAIAIGGHFTKTLSIGTDESTRTHNSSGGADSFIILLDSDGQYQWSKVFGGPEGDYLTAIEISETTEESGCRGSHSSATIVAVGNFGGSNVDLDPSDGTAEFRSVGSSDAFAVAVNHDGNFLWAGTFGDSTSDDARDIVVLSDQSFLISGSFLGTVDFDPGPGVRELSGDWYSGVVKTGFLLHLNVDGTLRNVWSMGRTGPPALAASPNGSLIFASSFHGTVDLDPTSGVDEQSTEYDDLGKRDVYVVSHPLANRSSE